MPICAVKDCGNIYQGNGKKLKFFQFPPEECVKNIWMKVLQIDSLPSDHSQFRVCSAHFSQNDIVNTNGRRRLIQGAIPLETARCISDVPDYVEPKKPINYKTTPNKERQPTSTSIPKLVCRICEDGSTRLTNLLLVTSKPILLKYLNVANVTFNFADKLPKFICHRCLNILDVAYEFKQQCECAHKKFQDMLLAHRSGSGSVAGDATHKQEQLTEFHLADDVSDADYEPSFGDEQLPSAELQLEAASFCDENACENVELLDVKNETMPYDVATNTIIDLNIEAIIDHDYDFPHEAVPAAFDMNRFVPIENDYKEYESVTDSDSDDTRKPQQTKQIVVARQRIVPSTTVLAAPMSYECYICPWAKYKLKRTLLNHMHKNHGFSPAPRPFVCKYCNKSYVDPTSLSRHNSAVHMGRQSNTTAPKRAVVCEFCGLQFSFPSNKQRHIKVVHGRKKPYTCDFCNVKFAQTKALKSHILRLHADGQTVAKKTLWPCDECPDICQSKTALKLHRRAHNVQRKMNQEQQQKQQQPPNVADVPCQKQTPNRVRPRNTEPPKPRPPRPHIPYNKRRAPCEVCGRLVLIVLMPTHMRIHTNLRPYGCPHCDMAFTTSSKLNIHVRVHTGARPYKCDCCDKTFRQKNSLRAHRIRVSGERAHKCSFCPKTFAFPFNLRLHERIHTGDKPYKCNLCTETFSNSGALRKHAAACHPNEIDVAVTLRPKQYTPKNWQ